MKKTRELNGAELASYVKERQAHTVRGLKQAWGVNPKLAIITTTDSPVTDVYIKLKQAYGGDIGVSVEVYRVKVDMLPELLDETKKDTSLHGVIVQLPLSDPSKTNQICALIPAQKDVDGLNARSTYTPATAEAINWLLNGYNIELMGAKIVILGNGKLVGAPLAALWRGSEYDVTVLDEDTDDLPEQVMQADIIVSATGSPGVLHAGMISEDTVIVDAGTTSEAGKIVGDAADDLYDSNKVRAITPRKGGVGPLTVAALFENVLLAARGSKGDIPEEA